ncbi:MAG: M23 family metallopeptidase [Arenimonas sp.]
MLKQRGFVLFGLLFFCTLVEAGDVYRWVDQKGQVHYGDKPPQETANKITQRKSSDLEAPSDIAEMSVVNRVNGWEVYVQNLLQGPVEVNIFFDDDAGGVTAKPALPLVRALKAREKLLLTSVDASGPRSYLSLKMSSMPGDSRAVPQDFMYQLPIDKTTALKIAQGFNGRQTHTDEQNRFAVDFSMPVGTPVLAARGGIVMQTSGDFDRAGLNREKYATRANIVRIVHDDGTMAVYAHLKQGGVMVREGQRVATGQLIAYSGNTGYSTGPHLHFCLQLNRNMNLVSIPFRMNGPNGELKLTRK